MHSMESEELPPDAPGRLVPYGRRPYYKPEPLPPSEQLDLDDEFYELLADATFWLGKLAGTSSSESFAPVLYTSLLRKEAMESAEIEGANVDFNALYRTETGPGLADAGSGMPASDEAAGRGTDAAATKDTTEVLNYEQALEAGIEALDHDEEITVDLLHSLHETLLSDVPEERVDTDTIGEFKQTPNRAGEFVPPPPEQVEGAMQALVTYIRTGGSYHPLVDIALIHYQFETVHPYGDGNGRLGRLLITMLLYDAGYLEQPTLYLSEYFNRNKQTYVDRMNAVRTRGEWVAWIEFFVRGVRNQAHESVERSLQLQRLRNAYEDEYGDSSVSYARLACSLFERPYFTTDDVAELLDVERSTAHRAINRLREEGLIEEVTGKERYQEFRAAEIFEILERPPVTY
jgi:Fic family protein